MPQFRTKAEWADARATELDAQAAKVDGEFVHYTKLARKNASVATLRSEARRFRSLAATFRRKGQ